MPAVVLCEQAECRRLAGHEGNHSAFPTEAWGFLKDKDKKKLVKAGFATPRGGAKGAYQNHVARSGRVIVPYERLSAVDLTKYTNGYVIRILPEQYFQIEDGKVHVRSEFTQPGAPQVGVDSFVLYRTYAAYQLYPPLPSWEVRGLTKDGVVAERRTAGVTDTGHYVLRLPRTTGQRPERSEGPPQGLFAPEYADPETNYLSQCVLAWLIVTSFGSPYTTTQASHLRKILSDAQLDDFDAYATRGALRHGSTSCPLCLRIVRYEQLHNLVSFEEGSGLVNAAIQVEGATRSTEVNLFHIEPLVYGPLHHVPAYVAWGHANCNTRLGQRRCLSLSELQDMDLKIGILQEDGVETIGWISSDYQMIRSPQGAVWIQICGDMTPEEWDGAPPPVVSPDAEEAEIPIAEGEDDNEAGGAT
jgi:hypothetical protein